VLPQPFICPVTARALSTVFDGHIGRSRDYTKEQRIKEDNQLAVKGLKLDACIKKYVAGNARPIAHAVHNTRSERGTPSSQEHALRNPQNTQLRKSRMSSRVVRVRTAGRRFVQRYSPHYMSVVS